MTGHNDEEMAWLRTFLLFVISACLLLPARPSWADSFITATEFYQAYTDIPLVQKAHQTHQLTDEILNALFDPELDRDVKLAIMNALSWGEKSQGNLDTYILRLESVHGKSVVDIDRSNYGDDELICLAYLSLLAHYDKPDIYIFLLDEAHIRVKNSFAISIMKAMAVAQSYGIGVSNRIEQRADEIKRTSKGELDYEQKAALAMERAIAEFNEGSLPDAKNANCMGWVTMNSVLSDKTLTMDMRAKAVEIIKEYTDYFRNDCEGAGKFLQGSDSRG